MAENAVGDNHPETLMLMLEPLQALKNIFRRKNYKITTILVSDD